MATCIAMTDIYCNLQVFDFVFTPFIVMLFAIWFHM